ncbi:hypothetical protein CHLNCDRAFT_20299 [Chlorella variabilis]|uniref:E2F-associated phosphoprotein n=1 Tax=Chlorella variabilis TaxID=554065 RepID=E1Z7J7_CHLVA|nr:hypothetical protein CHLNCDRAFT_20299 [Chlorella variabilis]EFN57931.1 hypothetical protein CHLNCDRAFT_20299 [Chlorella variabilis]|eukprot:XP_005850033.1 hypothetical protein CHLNCDRAFT_20299 [Chlorella variabilis]
MDAQAPEFYDAEADDKDEAWVQKMRGSHKSDALLSCPLCFTTLCIDCQQHAVYDNQFRAMFVMNCRQEAGQQLAQQQQQQQPEQQQQPGQAAAGAQQQQEGPASSQPPPSSRLNPVCCAVCETEVGLRDATDGVYIFINVFASNS